MLYGARLPVTRARLLTARQAGFESWAAVTKSSGGRVRGQSFYGGGPRRSAGDASRKYLPALDPQTGKVVWETADLGGGILASGLMSTAGDLVFYGDQS